MIRPSAVLLLLAFGLAAPAWAEPRDPLVVCGTPSSDDREALEVLNRWVRSVELHWGACTGRRLVFERRGAAVVMVLVTGGGAREREVPWIDQADWPLARLRAVGALAKTSVIIEGLLAEDRLGAPSTVVAAQRPRPARPSRKPPRVPSVLGPELPAPPPYLLPAPYPEPAPEETIRFGDGDGDPAPPLLDWRPRPAPVRKARRWAVEAGGTWRLRSPDISAWEVGAGLQWGLLLLHLSYQPTVTWELEGRPLELFGMGLQLGARFELARTAGFYVGATTAARVEWLVLKRADLANAEAVQIPEVGLGAGLLAGRRVGAIGLELRVEFLLIPTAREVEIPGGPIARLNLLGLRTNLVVYWGAGE